MLLDLVVVCLLLRGCWGSGVSWFGGCTFGLLGAELQLDFDQVVVAVEGCSGQCVDVVNDVSPIFVYYGVIQLHHIAIGSFVCVCLFCGAFSIQLCGMQ